MRIILKQHTYTLKIISHKASRTVFCGVIKIITIINIFQNRNKFTTKILRKIYSTENFKKGIVNRDAAKNKK